MNFRDLHHGDRPLLLPNAWDYITGAALAKAGFAAIGTTSLGVAAAAGKPDAACATRDETLLSSYGIAGVNIEEGRPDGSLVSVVHQSAVIAAAKEAASDVFVNARIDTFWLAGADEPSMAETLSRAHAYTEAGADGIFVPGAARDDQVQTLVTEVARPLNILHLPGRTDHTRLAELGVARVIGVARVSCGSLLFRAALQTTVATATKLSTLAGGRPCARGAVSP